MQHLHVDLPLEISLICANTLHFLMSCFDIWFDFENRHTWNAVTCLPVSSIVKLDIKL